MSDVAWITLSIRPWDDAWLAQDDELRAEFAELGLIGSRVELVGAMNGEVIEGEHPRETIISGEMRGGSYEIREESDLLPFLRDRGIAYVLDGDAKYEWDGDEQWWHPGMEKPFEAISGAMGRFLDKQTFGAFVKKTGATTSGNGSPERLIALITVFFDADPYSWEPGPDYMPTLKIEASG